MQIKFRFIALAALAISAVVFVSCSQMNIIPVDTGNTESSVNTEEPAEEVNMTELNYSITEKTEFTLSSPSTELKLSLKGGELYLSGLCDPVKRNEWLLKAMPVKLPEIFSEYSNKNSTLWTTSGSNDKKIVCTGEYEYLKDIDGKGNDGIHFTGNSLRMEYRFTGTGIRGYFVNGIMDGSVRVLIDGNIVKTLTFASPSEEIKEKFYIKDLSYGEHTIVIESSKTSACDLTFNRFEVYPGIKASWVLSEAGENINDKSGYTVRFKFICSEPKMTLESYWNVRGDDGPVQHTMYVINQSGQMLSIYSPQSFVMNVKTPDNTQLWRFHKESFQADTQGIYVDTLEPGKTISAFTTTVVDVQNNSGFIPCLVFDAFSHGMYVCWEWPHGRVQATDIGKYVILEAGVNDDFITAIPDGDRFLIPTAYIGTYNGDVDDGMNIMKHWFLWEKAPDKLTEDINEPLTQMDDQLNPLEHDYLEMGIQSVKWDYGWWGNEHPNDNFMVAGESTWRLRNETFRAMIRNYGCRTIEEYGALLKDKGVNLTVYILLHDSKEKYEDILTSVGKNGHPDWFSDRIASLTESADLGNEECVAFIKERLYEFITENNIGTWRTDMEPMPWSSPWNNRHVYGLLDTPYWNAVGFFEILDYFYDEISGFRLENCGSGGAYKDYATMSRSMVVQTEDRATYTNIRQVFYASSYALPPSQLMGLCACATFTPGHEQNIGNADYDYGLRSLIMGVPVVSNGGYETGHWYPGFEEAVSKYFNIYNNYIKPLQKNGNLYHVLPRPDNIHWDGIQYYDPDSASDERCGVLFIFKPSDTEGNTKTVRFKGLDPNTLYRLEFEDRKEQNCVKSGKELLETGLQIHMDESVTSDMIWISRES